MKFTIDKKFKITSADEAILDYINNHIEKIPIINISDIAKKTYTANSSVFRLLNKIGFRGWKDFQRSITSYLINSQSGKLNIYQNFFKQIKSRDQEEKIQKIADEIICANKIYIFGVGRSENCAEYASGLLNSLEQTSIFTKESFFSDGIINQVTDKDLVIFISYSGETKKIIEIAKKIKTKNKVAITKSSNNSLYKLCQKNLTLPFFSEPKGTIAKMSYIMTLIFINEICSLIELKQK